MAQEIRVYLEKIYLPFEGYRWAVIFFNDPHGSPLGPYMTKKEAKEDTKKFGLKIVPKPVN